MELRRCGKRGPMLSAVGLGCWQFGGGAYWGPCEQRDADAVVGRALDLGINYVDTAEAYNATDHKCEKPTMDHRFLWSMVTVLF